MTKFGPSSYDEYLTQLKRLNSVEDYKSRFKALSNRLRELLENHKLSYFISGLGDEIRLQVKMFKSNNLLIAYGLARIQEKQLEPLRRNSKGLLPLLETVSPKYPYNNPNITTKGLPKAVVLVQKINSAQMKDTRENGLCYYCDSKWSPNHKCFSPKLFLIEEVEEDSGEEVKPEKIHVEEVIEVQK